MPKFLRCLVIIVVIILFQMDMNKVEVVQNAFGEIIHDPAPLLKDKNPSVQKAVVSDESRKVKETKPTQQKDVSHESILPDGDKNIEEEEVEKNIMEGVLALLDNSQEEWIKGDLESALDMLDQAYALILDTDGTPDIARQKDDLRLLISKRILAIYSSMQSVTNGKRSEIPLTMNADVEKEIKCFQTYEKDFFTQSYKRSFLYRPIILRELAKAGLPEELSWLPLVESGFKVHALSSARALGPWQFIPSTGYKYNLNRDEWIDERMDIEKSTRAAIDYLKELHHMFGDWLTVLAAYNCGEGRVLKVISRQHLNYLDRFWDLYQQLPYETARYVPRFLATLHIIKNPKKYDMELNGNRNDQMSYVYETVRTNKSMKLQDIAKSMEISEDVLTFLNAELRYKATPDKEYELKIPIKASQKYNDVANQIPQWEKPKPLQSVPAIKSVVIRHKVKRGETISSIARRYKTTTNAITSYNNLSKKKMLLAGQYINIPIRGYRNTKVNLHKKLKHKRK
ncbi:MAG: transglycosylase SLT domain-containing protein [Syntrophaceae bacterium]|nr:transglycosylase SLT domain-containing protein [Syntrophaceae bacterium]